MVCFRLVYDVRLYTRSFQTEIVDYFRQRGRSKKKRRPCKNQTESTAKTRPLHSLDVLKDPHRSYSHLLLLLISPSFLFFIPHRVAHSGPIAYASHLRIRPNADRHRVSVNHWGILLLWPHRRGGHGLLHLAGSSCGSHLQRQHHRAEVHGDQAGGFVGKR